MLADGAEAMADAIIRLIGNRRKAPRWRGGLALVEKASTGTSSPPTCDELTTPTPDGGERLMASLLTIVRPFVYETMQELLVVQTGAIAKTVEVARTLRKHFPDAHIHGVVRDDDAAAVDAGAFDRLTAVRWEDRVAVVRELRAVRYDAVAMLLGGQASRAFRLLPYLVRTKNILLFNDSLDYFPLKWTRVRSLGHHLSGHDSIASLVRWAFGRVVQLPLAALVLLASTARIELKALRRRRLRAR